MESISVNTNNNGRYSTLKQIEHNSLFLKCELGIVTFFQRVQYGKGRKSNFREKYDKLSQPGSKGQYQQW